VSKIQSEVLIIEKIKEELKVRREKGSYKGKFKPISHFFGYEGRSGFPS